MRQFGLERSFVPLRLSVQVGYETVPVPSQYDQRFAGALHRITRAVYSCPGRSPVTACLSDKPKDMIEHTRPTQIIGADATESRAVDFSEIPLIDLDPLYGDNTQAKEQMARVLRDHRAD
ncbi:MAG TPA: hypothetical protein DES72_00955 [Gammaproteobacteria bacterium]|jgi:hypothetical protein|nr:hypothetical protein [Gammaproteobacteria bacterium]|tara:strand:- start:650 stop:1009 length:360 start_codon:yes stop_codon:yes gene_type:complete